MERVSEQIVFKEGVEEKLIPSIPNNSAKVAETQLWQEFKSGSETAFSTIYNKNVGKLYSYGLKLVYDEELVKDCIQDFFVELWNSKDRLSHIKSIKPYLYKSIRRKLISTASSRRKRRSSLDQVGNLEIAVPSQEINLVEKQRFDEDRRELQKALNKLNAKQREIVHLKFYGLLSYDEISEVMSLDKKGTYNLMAYTLRLLRKYLVINCLFAFPIL